MGIIPILIELTPRHSETNRLKNAQKMIVFANKEKKFNIIFDDWCRPMKCCFMINLCLSLFWSWSFWWDFRCEIFCHWFLLCLDYFRIFIICFIHGLMNEMISIVEDLCKDSQWCKTFVDGKFSLRVWRKGDDEEERGNIDERLKKTLELKKISMYSIPQTKANRSMKN